MLHHWLASQEGLSIKWWQVCRTRLINILKTSFKMLPYWNQSWNVVKSFPKKRFGDFFRKKKNIANEWTFYILHVGKIWHQTKTQTIWEANTSEQRETNTENIWPKPYEIRLKKSKCEGYEGIVGRTWRICGKAYGIKLWIQIENRCRSGVNEHTQIYWPKPKKSSSSSPPHPLPPRRKSPPQMEKEKKKKASSTLICSTSLGA
jgi:hypothetical protein